MTEDTGRMAEGMRMTLHIPMRPTPLPGTCAVCRVAPAYCLCGVDADSLRFALAQIWVNHSPDADGTCPGCNTKAVLCGYTKLLSYIRVCDG
jgi:hypothetical protein